VLNKGAEESYSSPARSVADPRLLPGCLQLSLPRWCNSCVSANLAAHLAVPLRAPDSPAHSRRSSHATSSESHLLKTIPSTHSRLPAPNPLGSFTGLAQGRPDPTVTALPTPPSPSFQPASHQRLPTSHSLPSLRCDYNDFPLYSPLGPPVPQSLTTIEPALSFVRLAEIPLDEPLTWNDLELCFYLATAIPRPVHPLPTSQSPLCIQAAHPQLLQPQGSGRFSSGPI
jgi:hypothetical protein